MSGRTTMVKAWVLLTPRGHLGGVADDTTLAVFPTREAAENRCLAGWAKSGPVVRCTVTYTAPRARKLRRK